MSEALLEIRDLSVSYHDFIAVEGVSMQVEAGQIVSLVGLNGAGKTTLMNAVVGLLRPREGQILFRGEDITGMPTDQIVARGLTLVPQGGRCFNTLSVQDNLLMGSYPKAARKQAKQELERVYELFPMLAEKKSSPVGTLSGGQRQMVAIGRALMGKPSCLIFDEISLGLAPAVINDIYRRILQINETDKTAVILIEQDMQRALRASRNFYVMLKGKVVMSGPSSGIDVESLKKNYFGI